MLNRFAHVTPAQYPPFAASYFLVRFPDLGWIVLRRQ